MRRRLPGLPEPGMKLSIILEHYHPIYISKNPYSILSIRAPCPTPTPAQGDIHSSETKPSFLVGAFYSAAEALPFSDLGMNIQLLPMCNSQKHIQSSLK